METRTRKERALHALYGLISICIIALVAALMLVAVSCDLQSERYTCPSGAVVSKGERCVVVDQTDDDEAQVPNEQRALRQPKTPPEPNLEPTLD